VTRPLGAVSPELALVRALDFLESHADVVGTRITSGTPPPFLDARGWGRYLDALSPAGLEHAEADPAWFFEAAPDAPPSLKAFARDAHELTRLDRLDPGEGHEPVRGRLVKRRKSEQIAALLALVGRLGGVARRLVDVGSGMGHLSRIASERLERDAVGIDWNERLLGAAMELAIGTRATFRVADALEGPLQFEPGDLVLGLHACGEVTDVALVAAAEAGAPVAFVSCCLQKVRAGRREGLSRAAAERGFVLSREVLGLSNLLGRSKGIEVAQATSLEAREARHALRLLLESRGIVTQPGEEMRGVNRRRARHGFAQLAHEVFATRGLLAPTTAEVIRFGEKAHVEFARMRRWGLPRTLVARLVECAVAFDRAAFLRERGYRVRVVEAFPVDTSPRNVAVVGAPPFAQLTGTSW